MKIILLKDVPKVGNKNDVKNAADGFALNFLIPRGLAETATPRALARARERASRGETTEKVREELAEKTAAALAGKTVPLAARANEEGHLFAGIHEKEIADAIAEALRISVEPRSLILSAPIKTVGAHEVAFAVGAHRASFILSVTPLPPK